MHSVSIIVPAVYEAAGIGRTAEHIHRLRGEAKVELVVVDGDPGGSTLAALPPAGALPGLTLKTMTAPRGRAVQMNAGARAATGGALVFLHADTLLPDGALDMLRRALTHCPAGAFGLGIDSDRPAVRLIAAVGRLRARLFRLPYGDQALFFRRDFFERLGGFAELPLMEDIELVRRVQAEGHCLAILSARVSTSARRWEREGPVYTTLRNWSLALRYLSGADPARLARSYPVHDGEIPPEAS